MAGRFWGAITKSTVDELGAAILDPSRKRPIIVVTTAGYTTPDRIPQVTLDEADELVSAVGDLADVAIVATGDISYALEALLPDKWHVFNGFCRSYPAGIVADPSIRRSPLRRRKQGEDASEQVISDALGHANASGALAAQSRRDIERVIGTVRGFLSDGEQALVDVGATMPAVLWRDVTSPGIPLEWLMAKDSTLVGDYDREHQRFVAHKSDFGPKEFLDTFPHGVVTLALVDEVTAETTVLRVHPDVSITIHRSDVSSNPLDRLDLFFVEGDVVRARVVHLSTGRPHLRLSDVDEDEPVLPPVAVVEGGTPWLVEGRTLSADPAPEDHDEPGPATTAIPVTDTDPLAQESSEAAPDAGPPRPMPGPGPRPAAPTGPLPTSTDTRSATYRMSMTIDELRSKVHRLEQLAAGADGLRQELELTKRTLRDTYSELAEIRERNADLQQLRKNAVSELQKLRKGQAASAAEQRGPRDRRDDWPDDESWLRHEIQLAWVRRVDSSEKSAYPLPADYVLGPNFIGSLDELDDGQFDKAMKCVVDVLTDRAKSTPGRELHPLRTGSGGNDPQRVREDGARGWRAAIEVSTASARRLHYWVRDGQIELSQVGVHDDMAA